MIRWRLCLAFALLLLLPTIIGGKNDDDDDEDSENKEDLKMSKIPIPKPHSRRSEESEEEEDEDDDDDDDGDEKGGNSGGGGMERGERQETMPHRRAPMVMVTPKTGNMMAEPRAPKRRPLECYVCAYKSETPLRACLDPTKFRVHTITCHSVDDRCFTSVISKGETYEAVVRGCRSGCIGSAETTCCEINRCNNQAFAMPLIQPRAAPKPMPAPRSKASKLLPPTILFFTTILLILQTAGKVASV